VNAKLPLAKKLNILAEIEVWKKYRPKQIAARHNIHQATVYKLWRNRHEIRAKE
jgi:DNA-binding CsgD family transcriptional regulator